MYRKARLIPSSRCKARTALFRIYRRGGTPAEHADGGRVALIVESTLNPYAFSGSGAAGQAIAAGDR
jgi:hypothetical protein